MPQRASLIELHFAVVLLGATALFGKLLTMNPTSIIVGRSCFTVLALLLVMKMLRVQVGLDRKKDVFLLAISGVLLALHWLAFFASIQMSTVAIGVLGFASYPMFVTFLEPFIFSEKLQRKSVISAAGVFVGICFLVPEWNFRNEQTLALSIAILSGLLLAFFTIVNRQFVRRYHFLQITFYQHLAAGLCMLPASILLAPVPNPNQWLLLLVLGVFFTALPQAMLVRCLTELKAQLVSVSVALEPLYAILLAIVLLDEIPELSVLFGGLIIMSMVFYASTPKKNHLTE
ncbi:MAG: drug/metabolite transporter (DMT)-like permease [Oceanicoccus sp.]|jgi:drug/metabolite transporter (DMT)-like permease